MAKTIGERLRDEREKQGLSIEDVAHSTRIHSDTLTNLEHDDYSSFASTTYAKSFLKKYAAHLGVDADDALKQFSSDATSPIVGGANIIRSVVGVIEPVERITGLRDSGNFAQVAGDPSKKGRSGGGAGNSHPVVLGLFLIVLLAAVSVLIIIGKDAETPDDAKRNWKNLFGGDSSAEVDAQSSTSAGEINPRPGERVTPAAPMTRPTAPPPVVADEDSTTGDLEVPYNSAPLRNNSDPAAQPIAQVSPPKAVPSTPIKARPIVAKPVVLPEPEAGDEADGAADNDDADGAESENQDGDNQEPAPEIEPKPENGGNDLE